jgi:hypothetical protein
VMARHACIPLDAPAKWEEALRGVRHAFAHTWENCYAMHLTTGFKTYLYCFEAENLRVVCPLAERTFQGHIDIVTPYGFSGFVAEGDCSEFRPQFADFVREQGYVCGYIGLNPVLEDDSCFAQGEAFRYNSIDVLDLTLDHDELFANLSTNRKRQLKDWEDICSRTVAERSMLIDFFLANYSNFFRAKRASSVYRFSKDTLSFLLDLKNVLLVGMQGSEGVEAVSVFAYTPFMGDFLFNVSLPQGRHHSAALLWYGINHLKALQIPLLNLGGGISENDGVARFKQRFGGKRLALRCLKQIYQPEVYGDLCRRMDVDHTDMVGYFPAYRSPLSKCIR